MSKKELTEEQEKKLKGLMHTIEVTTAKLDAELKTAEDKYTAETMKLSREMTDAAWNIAKATRDPQRRAALNTLEIEYKPRFADCKTRKERELANIKKTLNATLEDLNKQKDQITGEET